jgi:hypothetical protein
MQSGRRVSLFWRNIHTASMFKVDAIPLSDYKVSQPTMKTTNLKNSNIIQILMQEL